MGHFKAGSGYLSGWKDIANYLEKGVRTVQRYERHLGLPVHRPSADNRGGVIATKAEVDAWVNASPLYLPSMSRPTGQDLPIVALLDVTAKLDKLRKELEALGREMHTAIDQYRESIEEDQWRSAKARNKKNDAVM
jgi:hypothetical protein